LEEEMPEHRDAIEQLKKKLKGLDIAMMTTVDNDGYLRSRPMAAQELDDEGYLWFFTGASSTKTDEIRHDQHVNLSYMSKVDNRYVSVSGKAQVLRDRTRAKELWNPLYKAWFPEGLDDPNLALLRVQVEKAEYWDSPSAPVVHVVGFVKALATGKPYNPGENEKLEVQRS
jgi:general stress protein 26